MDLSILLGTAQKPSTKAVPGSTDEGIPTDDPAAPPFGLSIGAEADAETPQPTPGGQSLSVRIEAAPAPGVTFAAALPVLGTTSDAAAIVPVAPIAASAASASNATVVLPGQALLTGAAKQGQGEALQRSISPVTAQATSVINKGSATVEAAKPGLSGQIPVAPSGKPKQSVSSVATTSFVPSSSAPKEIPIEATQTRAAGPADDLTSPAQRAAVQAPAHPSAAAPTEKTAAQTRTTLPRTLDVSDSPVHTQASGDRNSEAAQQGLKPSNSVLAPNAAAPSGRVARAEAGAPTDTGRSAIAREAAIPIGDDTAIPEIARPGRDGDAPRAPGPQLRTPEELTGVRTAGSSPATTMTSPQPLVPTAVATPQMTMATPVAAAPLMPVREREVTGQIVSAASARGNGGVVNLTLDPPELGRVEIVMEIADQGVRATLTAERQATSEMIRRHAELLTQQFEDAGFSDINLAFGDRAAPEDSGPGEPGTGQEGQQADTSGKADRVSRPRHASLAVGTIDMRL